MFQNCTRHRVCIDNVKSLPSIGVGPLKVTSPKLDIHQSHHGPSQHRLNACRDHVNQWYYPHYPPISPLHNHCVCARCYVGKFEYDEGPKEGETPDITQMIEVLRFIRFGPDEPVQTRERGCAVGRRQGLRGVSAHAVGWCEYCCARDLVRLTCSRTRSHFATGFRLQSLMNSMYGRGGV